MADVELVWIPTPAERNRHGDDGEPPVGRLVLFKNRVLRAASPGYSSCFRCGVPWNHAEWHSTRYGKCGGCFPLCEGCWSILTPPQRLKYYRRLWGVWLLQDCDDGNDKWEAIERAVLNGL